MRAKQICFEFIRGKKLEQNRLCCGNGTRWPHSQREASWTSDMHSSQSFLNHNWFNFPGCYSKGSCTRAGLLCDSTPSPTARGEFLCMSWMHVCLCVCVCVCVITFLHVWRESCFMHVSICLHVNPCVHMHACVRVDTLSGGFHIAQQKGSVVALCAQSYKRSFLKHICPLHGVLIRLSISPPDTCTHNHAGCCCKTIIFTFLFCSCIHSFLTAKSVCGFRLSLKTARSRRLPVTGPMQHVLQQHSSGFPPVYTC